MVSKELLKKEIDYVQDEYLIVLYKIIKTFEHSDPWSESVENKEERKKEDWRQFIDRFAGSLADTPIERGEQGNFERREELL